MVWVSREFREEHRQAIDWLNRGHGEETSFFGVVVELLTVDDSRPAVNFKPVAVPNNWSKVPTRPDGEITDKQQRYKNFFQDLLDDLRDPHRFTNARVGQPQSWYAFSTGKRGFNYGISFAMGGRMRAELYIDTGDGDQNIETLEQLKEDSVAIERELGSPLEWEALEGKRACRLANYRTGSINDSDEKLEEYRKWSVERMLKFKEVFGGRLEGLV